MRALQENIAKFEQSFGVIEENEGPNMPHMNFGPPTTQA